MSPASPATYTTCKRALQKKRVHRASAFRAWSSDASWSERSWPQERGAATTARGRCALRVSHKSSCRPPHHRQTRTPCASSSRCVSPCPRSRTQASCGCHHQKMKSRTGLLQAEGPFSTTEARAPHAFGREVVPAPLRATPARRALCRQPRADQHLQRRPRVLSVAELTCGSPTKVVDGVSSSQTPKSKRCRSASADDAVANTSWLVGLQRSASASLSPSRHSTGAAVWTVTPAPHSVRGARSSELARRTPSANGSSARSSGKFSTCTPPVESAHASRCPCVVGCKRLSVPHTGERAKARLGVKLHTRHMPRRARVLQRCRRGAN